MTKEGARGGRALREMNCHGLGGDAVSAMKRMEIFADSNCSGSRMASAPITNPSSGAGAVR